MAVTVGPGGGGATASKDIATDLVAATEYQVVKLAVGAAGSATLISNANPVPTSPQGTVTVAWSAQTVAATQSGAWTVAATQSGAWTVAQGTAAASSGAWPTKIVDSAGTNVAAVSAAGAVKVDGSATAQPVTDNAGSLTVDAPVGTPVFARLSDGAAALVGQKTMANSLPVAIASDQGALTVASHAVTNAGTFAVQDSEKVVDNAAFTDGTTKVMPTGYVLDEVAGTALTENDIAAARINANRAQVLVIEDETTRGRRMTVKAASAAAAFTDPAAAVDIRPGGVLPAASTPADAILNSNVSNSSLQAYNMIWSGGTVWDRMRSGVLDGAASTGIQNEVPMLFNGTNYDRERNNSVVQMGDTGTKTATFNGASQTNYNARGVYILLSLGVVSGTSPTLTCTLQIDLGGTGANFINFGPTTTALTTTSQFLAYLIYPTNLSQTAGATPANLTTSATVTQALNMALPRGVWRLVYTIGGTTPSFAISTTTANYIL